MRKDVFTMDGDVIPAECPAFEKGVLTRNLRADLSLGCLNIQEGGKWSLCWSVKDSTKREKRVCYASEILLRKASASVMCLITNNSTESLKKHETFADRSIWLKYNALRSLNALFFVHYTYILPVIYSKVYWFFIKSYHFTWAWCNP
ncbi:hypothetical protein CEXT_291641 [Caerostris extrusa]|uniref:Uncharacterized protein n=1 Tax=Caerostris extrusa TaxID=172846 RepID=A0AAV4W8L5_CAEEX|nr:hypothetical protein CEXT_291641 [Caerostris extrusa]